MYPSKLVEQIHAYADQIRFFSYIRAENGLRIMLGDENHHVLIDEFIDGHESLYGVIATILIEKENIGIKTNMISVEFFTDKIKVVKSDAS